MNQKLADFRGSAWLYYWENQEGKTLDDLQRGLAATFPAVRLNARSMFALNSEFFDWVRQGRKWTTVRYRKDAIDYPVNLENELVETNEFQREYPNAGPHKIGIRAFGVKRFGDLNDTDGIRDGFRNRQELLETLTKIYGEVRDDELVSIYLIEITHDAGSVPR